MIFSIIILAVSLSIDALFVGVAYGIKGTLVPVGSKMVICLFSVLYAGAAVFAGTAVSRFIPAIAGRLIGAAILALIGLTMILKAFIKRKAPVKKEDVSQQDSTIFRLIIRSLGITIQVLRNPDAGDIDSSGVIDFRESILLGSALSIDAVGVGIGSSLSGLGGWYIPLAVGLCQLLFLSAGLFAGKHFSAARFFSGKYSELLPGVFLLGLAFIRLL